MPNAKELVRSFFHRAEGHLFFMGLSMWAVLLAQTLFIFLALDAAVARALVWGVATEVLTGREGGIPVYLTSGAPRILVFQYSVTQDIAAALLVYPFFLLGLHHYRDRDNAMMRRVRRMEERARAHRAYVRKWGPLGIFLFMLVPFLVNGPLLALVIGRIAGITTRYLVVPVVAATIVAAAAWTWGIDALLTVLGATHPLLGYAFAGALVSIVIGLAIFDQLRERRLARRRERHTDQALREGQGPQDAKESPGALGHPDAQAQRDGSERPQSQAHQDAPAEEE